MIEVEVLRARALHTAGRTDVALDALEHAVRLAEPHGWVRFFLDAGSSTRELLHLLAAREPASQYLRDLRAATADTPAADVAVAAAASPPRHAWEAMPGGADEPVNGQLIDSLSERELEVLRMLASSSSTAPGSPASSWCRSTRCAPTPSTSTPSSASTTGAQP